MNEFFIHFIWKFQFFDKQRLKTSTGEEITILSPGHHNTDQGPDFSHARIRMDGMDWHGNVEIHLKASDWFLHKHEGDNNYDTIILHVVWENDKRIKRRDGSLIPVLELKDRVDFNLIDKYRTFINSGIHLPCQYYLKEIPEVHVASMIDRTMSERLERKGKEIVQLSKLNNNDWEETFWQVLVSNFGFKINNDAFEQLSRAVPFKLLMKHSDNQMLLEALLFGQAGFLDGAVKDSYSKMLKREFDFLSHTYSLEDKKMQEHQWKFLRTRPYNFPTIRISQLAALMKNGHRLINIVHNRMNLEDYFELLKTPVSSYWEEHYKFGEKIKGRVPGITENSVNSIIINVVIPFRTAQYIAGLNDNFPEEKFNLLESIPGEVNKITKEWERVGVKMKTAFDSQAGLELYNQYCLKKKCLSCSIGTYIINH